MKWFVYLLLFILLIGITFLSIATAIHYESVPLIFVLLIYVLLTFLLIYSLKQRTIY